MMSLPTDNRLHKVRIQLNLKIPDGCSLSTSQYLHSSLRQKFSTNFKGFPLNSVESRPGPGLSFSLLYFIYGAGLQPRLRAISLLTTRCASARLPLPLVLPPIA